MSALRVARSYNSIARSSSLLRTFSTTSQLSKTPSIADITPESLAAFDRKQKEFREKINSQKKPKDASQLGSSSSSQAPTAPDASNASSNSDPLGLGSLTSSPEASTSESENGKQKGKLSSLIYGTKEGREMDQEIEKSFSEVLARGKYVHSIVFHEVKPDKVDEYVELVGKWYPRMAGMPENKVHLVGSWRTEVGDCDTFGKPQSSVLKEHL